MTSIFQDYKNMIINNPDETGPQTLNSSKQRKNSELFHKYGEISQIF